MFNLSLILIIVFALTGFCLILFWSIKEEPGDGRILLFLSPLGYFLGMFFIVIPFIIFVCRVDIYNGVWIKIMMGALVVFSAVTLYVILIVQSLMHFLKTEGEKEE
ncbi:hypothetical protein Plano_1735 [Planococcus sp. PAMC 21323]|uniref:hypothetical protein n=1 Tax=Planococcus sp. PAMC 21323 TaxID=1526927 RepID=UPI00056FF2B2|nr:hypothetical protein [Planococcus sp. PAMC 21323]AIY05700.1 hypothetical protein Plano_1735 [Planococcus sp. PAMC 21323]